MAVLARHVHEGLGLLAAIQRIRGAASTSDAVDVAQRRPQIISARGRPARCGTTDGWCG
jgi:hypothetical protein